MSDDTPTERIPSSSDAQPTEILASSAGPSSAGVSSTGATARPAGRSRGLLYTLIAVGAVLLIALIIVVALLAMRGQQAPVAEPSSSASASAPASPSAEPTPSASPSVDPEPEPTPTPTPDPPAPVGPTFDSFSAPASANCDDGVDSMPLTFSWSSGNAQTAYIGVATTNAKAGPYEGGLPVVYTYTNLNYQCSENSQIYTVTLEDTDGKLTHKTVTITK